MTTEKLSQLGFEETVSALQNATKRRSWEIGPAMDMQAAIPKAGHNDAKPFMVLTMCKQDLTEALLKIQAMNNTLPFAPCRKACSRAMTARSISPRPTPS